jgi:hypothetical protein
MVVRMFLVDGRLRRPRRRAKKVESQSQSNEWQVSKTGKQRQTSIVRLDAANMHDLFIHLVQKNHPTRQSITSRRRRRCHGGLRLDACMHACVQGGRGVPLILLSGSPRLLPPVFHTQQAFAVVGRCLIRLIARICSVVTLAGRYLSASRIQGRRSCSRSDGRKPSWVLGGSEFGVAMRL